MSPRKGAGAIALALFFLSAPQCQARDEEQALSTAIHAAYVQTGAARFVNDFQRYGEKELQRKARKQGIDKPLALIVNTYIVLKRQEIHIPLRQHSLYLRPNSVIILIRL
jgi:hypothetical protein